MTKENISKTKREPNLWEHIFANDTSDKNLTSKIYKNSTPGRQITKYKNGQKA